MSSSFQRSAVGGPRTANGPAIAAAGSGGGGGVGGGSTPQQMQLERIRQSLLPFRRGGAQNRILLGLTSSLPNEIDYALMLLTKITYFFEDFQLTEISFLLEALLDLCDPWLKLFAYTPGALFTLGRYERDTLFGRCPERDDLPPAVLDRVVQVFQLLQNACNLDYNVTFATRFGKFMEILLKGMMSDVPTIRRYATDILEHISPRYAFRPDTVLAKDSVWTSCMFAVFSDDSAMIKVGLRVLNRIISIGANEKFLFVEPAAEPESGGGDAAPMEVDALGPEADMPGIVPAMVKRAAQLLLLADEAIVYESLEYLYNVTRIGDAVTRRVCNILSLGKERNEQGTGGTNPIPRLLQIVAGRRGPSAEDGESPAHGAVFAAAPSARGADDRKSRAGGSEMLIASISTSEPARLKHHFAVAHSSNLLNTPAFVRQRELYDEYAAFVEASAARDASVPVQSPNGFIVALASAFPEARINYIKEDTASGQIMSPIILGISRRHHAAHAPRRGKEDAGDAGGWSSSARTSANATPVNGEDAGEGLSGGATADGGGDEGAGAGEDDGVAISCAWVGADGELCEEAAGGFVNISEHVFASHCRSGSMSCRWATCRHAFHAESDLDLMLHLRTHLASAVEAASVPRAAAVGPQEALSSSSGRDPIGAPLTAALIVRNIARVDAQIVLPYEPRIAVLAASGGEGAKAAGLILHELLP